MKKKKLLIIIILSVVLAALIVGSILFFLKDKKELVETPTEVFALEQIVPLETGNSADASELVKNNIVKVINQIGDKQITGTGFFDKSGYLVTNSHIVDIAGFLSVEYADGTKANAQIFSNDITSDIALLIVDSSKVRAMYYGETLSLKVTDEVYAIGFPYALEGEASVTKGILSARRSAGGIEFLQSDISLNIGNSGGPLINDRAELLGINTYATENASIGMAISSESLQILIAKLIEDGKSKYLDDDRPQNALSVVLQEIGYETEDIYGENDIINEKFHNGEENSSQNGKASENNTVDKNSASYSKKCRIAEIQENSLLTIDGYYNSTSTVSIMNDTLNGLVLKNNENSLNFTLKYNGVDVTKNMNIYGNSNLMEGANFILLTYTMDGCDETHFLTLFAIKPYTFAKNVKKVYSDLCVDKCSDKSGNCYFLRFQLQDEDGLAAYPIYENIYSINTNSDIYNTIFKNYLNIPFSVPLDSSSYNYVKFNIYYVFYDDGVEKEILLKTYAFNTYDLLSGQKEVPTNEIKALYNDITANNDEWLKITSEISLKNNSQIYTSSSTFEINR